MERIEGMINGYRPRFVRDFQKQGNREQIAEASQHQCLLRVDCKIGGSTLRTIYHFLFLLCLFSIDHILLHKQAINMKYRISLFPLSLFVLRVLRTIFNCQSFVSHASGAETTMGDLE